MSLLAALLELVDASAALGQRPRVRMVAACQLLPERACPCGARLCLPGAARCDLCLEEERSREVQPVETPTRRLLPLVLLHHRGPRRRLRAAGR